MGSYLSEATICSANDKNTKLGEVRAGGNFLRGARTAVMGCNLCIQDLQYFVGLSVVVGPQDSISRFRILET